jgi:pyruvate/2-oxoglutarate dehydrogenase complex dihydrolipoamide dehydrogenase (E3) component
LKTVERGDRIISRDDPDVSETAKQVLEQEDVNFKLNANCFSLGQEGDDVVVKVECDDSPSQVRGILEVAYVISMHSFLE